jgi:glycine cleavage system T protein (aminomethyltransferase)
MIKGQTTDELKRTPLYALHLRLGARIVAFAGYDMPVQYPSGIIKEHLHTRAAAGLFDVSHMGQIALRPRSGRLDEAARALETLVPGDVLGLVAGRQCYTLFTNTEGGVIDDLMVSNRADHLMLVVNAARKSADEAHLRQHLSASCLVEPLIDRALIALQGPKAETALAALVPEVRVMAFMDVRTFSLFGTACGLARSGYTGGGRIRDQRAGGHGRGLVRGAVARSGGGAGWPWRPRQLAARSWPLSLWLRPRRNDHSGRGRA